MTNHGHSGEVQTRTGVIGANSHRLEIQKKHIACKQMSVQPDQTTTILTVVPQNQSYGSESWNLTSVEL
uniref:Uncharacterized protein n=1 Tax=Megaselia scalaris TaxID=36166 RepID=T1GNJ3_MEGSC